MKNRLNRAIELKQLHDVFARRGAKVISIIGPPGIGKTQLAIEFMKANHRLFPGGGAAFSAAHPFSFTEWIDKYNDYHGMMKIIALSDCDRLASKDLADQVIPRLRTISNVSVILESSKPLGAPVDYTLNLKPLTEAQILQLFKDYTGIIPDDKPIRDLVLSLGRDEFALRDLLECVNHGAVKGGEISSLMASFASSGLFGPDGEPLELAGEEFDKLAIEVSAVSKDLIDRVAKDPQILYQLTPRKFEEFTAELMRQNGFQVELTPITRDGGKDIYLAAKPNIGSFLFLVECKRYAPDQPVGISYVQRLYGVVEAARATAGLLVTTSSFSKDARKWSEELQYRLSLINYIRLRQIIQSTHMGKAPNSAVWTPGSFPIAEA